MVPPHPNADKTLLFAYDNCQLPRFVATCSRDVGTTSWSLAMGNRRLRALLPIPAAIGRDLKQSAPLILNVPIDQRPLSMGPVSRSVLSNRGITRCKMGQNLALFF